MITALSRGVKKMKIYVVDVKNVELESPITPRQLLVLVDAWRHGIAHSQIIVSHDNRKGMLDTRDIDVERTLPDVVFDKESIIPPAALRFERVAKCGKATIRGSRIV